MNRVSDDLLSLPEDVDTLAETECPECGGDVIDFVCADCGREVTIEDYDEPDTQPRGEAAERKEEILEEFGSEEEEVMAKVREATKQEIEHLYDPKNHRSTRRANQRPSARRRSSSVLTKEPPQNSTKPRDSQYHIEDDSGDDAGFGSFTTKEEAEEFLEESGANKSDFSVKEDDSGSDDESKSSSRQAAPTDDAPLVTQNDVSVGDETDLSDYGGPASRDDFFNETDDVQAPDDAQTHMSPDNANTGDGATSPEHFEDDRRETSREARLMKIFNFVEERERLGLSKPDDRNSEIARYESMNDEELDAHISATREASANTKSERVPVRQNRLPSMGQATEDKPNSDDAGFFFL